MQAYDHSDVDTLFLKSFDEIHYTWYGEIASSDKADVEELKELLKQKISLHILETYDQTELPVYIHINYPSVNGVITGCAKGNNDTCLQPSQPTTGQYLPGNCRTGSGRADEYIHSIFGNDQ